MNDQQKQVLIGSLLGDGWLISKCKNWRFCKKQKLSRREYLDWHFSIFGNLSSSITIGQSQLNFEYYKNTVQYSKFCLFSTCSNEIFNKYGYEWYKNINGEFVRNNYGQKIKILPDINLTSLILAIWFCDDGTNCVKQRQAMFYTNNFSLSECEILKSKIFATFGVKSSINTNRSQPIIRIASSSYVDFIEIIKPHILWPCFEYKSESRLSKLGERHWKATITDENIQEIKLLHSNGVKQKDIATKFNVSRTCICNILNGKRRQ